MENWAWPGLAELSIEPPGPILPRPLGSRPFSSSCPVLHLMSCDQADANSSEVWLAVDKVSTVGR